MNEGTNRPNYAAILYFLSKFKVMYAVIIVVALPVSALEGFGIAAFYPLFSNMLGGSSEGVGGLAGMADKAIGWLPVSSAFVGAVVMLIAIFLARTVGVLVRDLLVAYIGAKILYTVRKEIMERYGISDSEANYRYRAR